LQKSLHYWIHRYLLHPQSIYQFGFLTKDHNDCGFVVLKSFTDKDLGIDKGHIIDFIISDDISETELVLAALNYFAGKVSIFEVWPTNTKFCAALESLGFIKGSFDIYFGFKNLDLQPSQEKTLKDIGSWHLSLGNNDAF
jgi:hypothetical protein